jgi:predicted nicotinamide N-methyase
MSPLRFRYQTLEVGDHDIHLRTLRDRQQYADPHGHAEALGISSATWPLFGIVWASGEVLAQLMLDYDIAGRRILEVGCGIGLASLLLNEMLADITATDQHPCAQVFLEQNVELNNGRAIPFERTGWADELDTLGRFDLIIGSDLLYEPEHAELLAHFIDQHAKETCEVLVVDPGRGNRGRFSTRMAGLGYQHSRSKAQTPANAQSAFSGDILRYTRAA